MKKLFFILSVIAFTSCQKTALVPQHYEQVTEVWETEAGHDTAVYNAAMFCFKKDSIGIDTITLKYTKDPTNPNKFSYVPGSLYVDPKTKELSTGIYDRYYHKLRTKL